MSVDTKVLRNTAEGLNGKEWVKVTFAARHQLFASADEIDSLRAKLAEAERTRDMYGRDLKQANEFLRDHNEGVRPYVDRNVALRQQLAEARANTVPWRNAPAKGDQVKQYNTVVAVVASDFGDQPIAGYFTEIAGLIVLSDYIGGIYQPEEIRRFFYVDDVMSVTEKAEATNV